ncbi:hypothetical protein [Paenibacillus montanisoli]|uniref:Uncharacterized protein n=1 Tax=Paenibacillus montanisoli TaxID=2081970 RepID=A0A328TZI7_9BACL|nr:hypothetical protein [Paenibacillus montanisoli]RAP74581.1 hypothetical protein DL346_21200 [Paenibacillus montanisoli]
MLKWLERTILGPTVNEQYSKLEEIGIRLNGNYKLADILHFPVKDYQAKPYLLLLMDMGSEPKDSDREGVICDQLWCFDRECIEDQGDYSLKLNRIGELIKDELELTDISDDIDFEAERASVSFRIDGRACKYDLNFEYDWLDINLFKIFSMLLEQHGSNRRFYYFDTGNNLLVALLHREQWNSLKELTPIFQPA